MCEKCPSAGKDTAPAYTVVVVAAFEEDRFQSPMQLLISCYPALLAFTSQYQLLTEQKKKTTVMPADQFNISECFWGANINPLFIVSDRHAAGGGISTDN